MFLKSPNRRSHDPVSNTPFLLQNHALPPFNGINNDEIEPALRQLIDDNLKQVDTLLLQTQPPSWQTLIAPLEEAEDRLNKIWSPVSHLNAVKNSDALRDAYNACLPHLSAYGTSLGQNTKLNQAFKDIAESAEYQQYSAAQKAYIKQSLRDFHLSGVDLSKDKKQRYADISKRMSELTSKFSENVLDATAGWFKHLPSKDELAGLPDSALALFEQQAQQRGLEGYVVTLDIPCYLPLMQYAENSELRQELYVAYTSRASDQGPNAGQWNNDELMVEIINLRQEKAELLGFSDYAQLSLASKMADSPAQVITFLEDLAEKSKPFAEADYQELLSFAQKQLSIDPLQAWDIPFASEKLRLHKYAVSQEELRPYFPIAKVIEGMFVVASRLFNIEIIAADAELYHQDVGFYHVCRGGEVIAKFYLDCFARDKKRGGAWMADAAVRRRLADGSIQLPVAFLTCNFTPATSDMPSLLTHQEVTTLFHEFGHGLHHMLTQIEVSGVSGINGVEWDAVELPSQFMENFCWEPSVIPLISSHYQSGDALPSALLEKLIAAKNFQSGMQMVRQIEFSLFDLHLHSEGKIESAENIQQCLDRVREQVAVYPVPVTNRFQNSFSHIFAGGYAAGYYSYKWAEVLSADAFSLFEENGLFDQSSGHRFLTEILEKGGSQSAKELFVAFRGREPSAEALLRHCGITV
jgi:oligopeptidase A